MIPDRRVKPAGKRPDASSETLVRRLRRRIFHSRKISRRQPLPDPSNALPDDHPPRLQSPHVQLRIPALTREKWPAGQVDAVLVRSKPFTFGQFDGNFSAAAGPNVEDDGRLTLYAAHHWRVNDGLHFSACC
jgi:hypothetical protein